MARTTTKATKAKRAAAAASKPPTRAARKPSAKDATGTTAEIAKAFTDLLKAGDHAGAAERFNAERIVSVEAMDGPMARVQGTAAVKAKSDWWYANHTVHSASAAGPYVNGDQFAVRFDLDVTVKQTGQRTQMQEIGLYTVKAGRIVEERFFY